MVSCLVLALLLLTACTPQSVPETTIPATIPTTQPKETALPSEPLPFREPEEDEFVAVADWLPGVYQHLPYATAENFTGTVIYDFSDAYLRYGTVKKLAKVQSQLEKQGYSLLIWDAFRPAAAQWKLWEICPDAAYVSDPNKGYSSHSRGNTIDVTLVLSDGSEVEMPTGFDDFTPLADRDYTDCPAPAADNARLLESTMEAYGFTGYSREWWHFTDETDYDVAEDFTPIPVCTQTLSADTPLFSRPDVTSGILAWLEPGETLTLRATQGEFCLVQARGGWGYVLLR